MNTTKLKVTLNIGENTSSEFGAIVALIKTQDKHSVESALQKVFMHLKESKGVNADYDSVNVYYINRKTKHNDAYLENAFCVEFTATSQLDIFDCEFSLYSAIGMLSTVLLQEAIAFSLAADFGGRWIETSNGLAGLFKHKWGNVFDSSQFITVKQVERGEF